MSQRTRDEFVAEVGFRLGLDVSSGSECETSIIDMLDDAQRRVWTAREWYERRGQVFVATVAPYSTGTATLTLGSTTVTGSGTTWTTLMSNRKVALALGSPWYPFTYVGATSGTISQAYAETTASASAYTIFADEYDTASDVDRIVSVHIERPEFGGKMIPLEESALDNNAFVHGVSGIPRYFSLTNSTTAGTRRLRVWPIPDAIYRLRVRYWKSCTDLSAPGAVSSLGGNKDRVLLYATMLEAQTLPGAVQITSESQVDDMIEKAWIQQDDLSPITYQRARIDQGFGSDALWLDATNAI